MTPARTAGGCFSLALIGLQTWLPGPGGADEPAPPQRGQLLGRVTAADSGRPVAGAAIRVLVEGVADHPPVAEAISGADGRYAVDLPLGHAQLWGVQAPAGFYTQDPGARDVVVITAITPRVVRDFVVQPGAPWRVESLGLPLPLATTPYLLALPDPGRTTFSAGEVIDGRGDLNGRGVLTLPPRGGSFRLSFSVGAFPAPVTIPAADLEVDRDFDPRQVAGSPEAVAGQKAVRLKDVAGRTAVVTGVAVRVDAGQAILTYPAEPVSQAGAFALRGRAVDEAGRPVAGAKFTAAFSSGLGGSMSPLVGTTDDRGAFTIPKVVVPQRAIRPDHRISMVGVKAGYESFQTKELPLPDVRAAGQGDFGTVVLMLGRTLRGQVVDQQGRPVHGAVVINLTHPFRYSHLCCRTDADGRFTMPDLGYGEQTLFAAFGERSCQEKVPFAAGQESCLLTVRLLPRSGARATAAAPPRPVPPQPRDDSWDLTPPAKEPRFQHEPLYALVVLGPRRENRVWLILDGETLYADTNGNGDLTEPGKRLTANNPKDGSNKFGNPGSHTHFDVFEFTVTAGGQPPTRFRFWHWIRDPQFVPKTDFDKKWHAAWQTHRWEQGTLYRLEGIGQDQNGVTFVRKPADAQVCHYDGPLTFTLKLPEYAVLQHGEAGSDLAFHVGTLGRPTPLQAEHRSFTALNCTEVPAEAYLIAEVEFPGKGPADPPIRRKYLLKQRC